MCSERSEIDNLTSNAASCASSHEAPQDESPDEQVLLQSAEADWGDAREVASQLVQAEPACPRRVVVVPQLAAEFDEAYGAALSDSREWQAIPTTVRMSVTAMLDKLNALPDALPNYSQSYATGLFVSAVTC